MVGAGYTQYSKNALRASPFYNTETMGGTVEKKIDWAYNDAAEKGGSSKFDISSHARQIIETSMVKVDIVFRIGLGEMHRYLSE